MENKIIETLAIDKFSIIETIITQVNSTDRKDYELQREQFGDEILIDFGEVRESQKIKADDLINWARVAYTDMTTMHMTFNHQVTVDGEKASCYSYGRALHKTDDNSDFWNIYAIYEHKLIRSNGKWRISGLKMQPVFSDGNANIVEQNFEKKNKELKR